MEIKQRKNTLTHIKDIIERINLVKRINPKRCNQCGSMTLRKYGIRQNKGFWVQRFRCKDCGKSTMDRTSEFAKLKYDDEFVEQTIKYSLQGYSSRQIQKKLKIHVPHTTIIEWIKRFIINPNFQVNASHRQEVRDKISLTLRGK